MNYLNLSIEEIRKALDEKQVTSEELVKESIEKAKKYQEELNVFVTITEDYAQSQLSELNKASDSPLKGIPYAIKDNFSTKGVLSTASSNILKDYIPFFDATVVEKLHSNGALMIGKTVLDELAMGGSGATGHTGPVSNPWDSKRLIGGSSAGSAAAVAAGIVPYAIGSDTGDSIRRPAAFGGIVGFKPTYGLVSRYGAFAFASSLDTVGCLARSVKDVAYVIDVIKGNDERDMTSLSNDNIKFSEELNEEVKGKKLFYIKGLLDRESYKDSMDTELDKILNNFDEVIGNCKKIGIEVDAIDFDLNLIKAILPSYITIACAEATTNNSNLLGIIFGSHEDGKTIEDIMINTRTSGFSELIKRRFILGSYVLQKENQEKLFLNAGRVRRLIVDKLTEFFDKYDGMILPATECIAPYAESEVIDKLSEKHLLLFQHMAIANFGGFPSIVLPCGFVDNMPIGINLTGGIKTDLNILNIAYAIEGTMNYKGQIAGGDK